MAGQNHYATSTTPRKLLTVTPTYEEDQKPSSPGSSKNTCHHHNSSSSHSDRGATVTTSPTSSGRHPVYHGIRSRRGGKWVSEIRQPRKTTRIWLGTFPTPEMAAAAYDVAALALKGPEAAINFPDRAPYYPVPASSHSASDIRAAAASAAAARGGDENGARPRRDQENDEADHSTSTEFVDVEALFDMPNMLADMAEGMLLSPPRRLSRPAADDSPENYSTNDNLWSYY